MAFRGVCKKALQDHWNIFTKVGGAIYDPQEFHKRSESKTNSTAITLLGHWGIKCACVIAVV